MPAKKPRSAGIARVRSAADLVADAKRRIREMAIDDARLRLAAPDPPVLIDVREEYEHEIARLGGSVHVPRGALEMTIEHDYPDRGTELLLYCSRGDRSALAAWTLVQMGYRQVASLEGGLHAWRERGLPVVVPSAVGGEGSGI
jgi:sulfur-carrier protein adenylyltransferase/sulfurtransferase